MTTSTASFPSNSAGNFQIHYFSIASSYTKKTTESLPAPLSLRQLFGLLEEMYPGIREKILSSCGVSLGMEYVDLDRDDVGEDVVIRDGDEVGIIPPVSSG